MSDVDPSLLRGERPTHDFDAIYADPTPPPWDIGHPQAAFATLAESGALLGRVLDVGCGTGEHALLAASLGLEAVGVDAAPTAIELATRKALARGLTARFVVGDALELAVLGQPFDTVLDCGLFHCLDDEERERFCASLAAVVPTRGRYHLLCFSERVPGDWGPRRVTERELRDCFEGDWELDDVERAVIEVTTQPDGVQAWQVGATPSMTDVRSLTAAEIGPWVRQLGLGFHVEMAEGYAEYLLTTFDLDRTIGAFDGERVVGTLRSFASQLTVPGQRTVAASALTNVSVAPTHRRRGLLGEMIVPDLRASADRGEPVSVLIAAEYPIYGRFGYGPAIETASYRVDARAATFRDAPEGSVEVADLATLRRVGPELYDRFRVAQPGSIERPVHWWDRVTRQVVVPGAEPSKDRVVLYRSRTGDVEGFATYVARSDWDGMRPNGTLQLQELLSVTPAAHHALWSYLCGVDLLTSIEAPLRAVDEVLPFLLQDGRAVTLTMRSDFVWVRVLDVVAALAGRSYATEGRLVLEVLDPLGLAQGTFVLDGGPGGAVCAPSTATVDLTVPVDALGALYLGGTAARTLELSGRLREHRAGAVALADAMLRSARAPWCTTWF